MSIEIEKDKKQPDASEDASPPERRNDSDEWAQLRKLLLGPEQQELNQVHERLKKPLISTEELANQLPEAIIHRNHQDGHLTKALQPSIEEAIRISVKKNPRILIDVLFPLMGPAIRKAISQALSTMMQSLNQTLETSLSLQGMKWRMEAFRTGRSFAEVVLLHTLVYRVEQMFLIHKETGLLLQHVIGNAVVAQDADMVSGMFSAIMDFVKDSFGVKEHETLEAMQVGELTVWIEQGPHALIACVIRGDAPRELRLSMQDAIETIHLEQREDLSTFEGDASPFERSRGYLESCLQAQYGSKSAEKKVLSPALIIIIILGLLIVVPWGYIYIRDSYRWSNYLDRLRKEQGIVITTAETRSGKYYLAGLRDPLAADPNLILTLSKLDANKVESHWEPYHALYANFILLRARTILAPPPTVTLRFENSEIFASGVASSQWINDARKIARAIPGVNKFHDEELIDVSLKDLMQAKESLEALRFNFLLGNAQILPEQIMVLDDAARLLKKIFTLAREADRNVNIEVIGYTDELGTADINLRLSKERAQKVITALALRGINTSSFTALGQGTKWDENLANAESEARRRVCIKVKLNESE